MSAQPKKPRRIKNKRLNITPKDRWERIIKDVDKNEVPVTCLESITVTLLDNTEIDINVRQLIQEGNEPELLEEMINSRLASMDDLIKDVDFYINIESVAKTVQPFTDDLLKKLS